MNDRKESEPQIITDQKSFDSLVARLRATGWFAFDTEFVGEDKYQPEICLIQAATNDCCALIDPMTGIDVEPFWELVADPSILVLVHAGNEDLGICWKTTSKKPTNVFDLQIAAGMIGLGYPTSLVKLCRATIGEKIHKSQTLTDWRRRPLTQEQIRYAIADVLYLPAMYESIRKRLTELGRLSWIKEECEALCDAVCNANSDVQKLRRLKGSGSMSRRELAIVDLLLEERDKLAVEYNRPARVMLKDHLVVEMARRGWTDVERIRSLRGLSLSATALRRMADAIAKGKQVPVEDCPEPLTNDDSPEEETLITLLTAVLRDHCERNDLAFSLVGKKQDIRGFVQSFTRSGKAAEPHAFAHGWRKEALGDTLTSVLSGTKSVRVVSEQGKLRFTLE